MTGDQMRSQVRAAREETEVYKKTLRDQFAMAALTGLCSMSDSTGIWSWKPNDAANQSYIIADAMMEARK